MPRFDWFMGVWVYRCMYGCMDAWMYGCCMDVYIYGRMGAWYGAEEREVDSGDFFWLVGLFVCCYAITPHPKL